MQEHKHQDALTSKLLKLSEDNKSKNLEIRRLRQRIKELSASRASWKEKAHISKKIHFRAIGATPRPALKAIGYHYHLETIRMCVILYLTTSCGYRGIVRILLYFQLEYGIIGSIPSKSAICSWVEKLGCYKYSQPSVLSGSSYGLIIDECMVVGNQRMLLVLGVKSEKKTASYLNLSEVDVLEMSVKSSWKSEDIVKLLAKVTEKMGKKPAYVISDGCSTLRKGIADAGLIRIHDVSHQIALLLEKRYKNREDFIGWQKDIALAKFKGIMTNHAYLLAPKQRTIARFMNLSACISWTQKLLANFDRLTTSEQTHFQWIHQHQGFIEEIAQVFECSNQLMSILKNKGLSDESIKECQALISADKTQVDVLIRTTFEGYLQNEQAKLPDSNTNWHCCSNIIESLFGKLKEILPSNLLNGVSPIILTLPLRTGKGVNMNIAQALEQISMSDLKQWKKENLIDNQVIKRNKIFKN